MITKQEIVSVADETGLRPAIVEKDWVLGWLLAAINEAPNISGSWAFKGGTCLKKCYFETYRFSEDLDFTLQDGRHINESFLQEQFTGISEWLYEVSGIQIPVERLRFDIYTNPRGHASCQGRLYYESYFSNSRHSLPKIKLDLTADEILVMPPTLQMVLHAYSDVPQGGIHVDCYSYPEVFGEKVRALGERGRPRDLYDVINLFRNDKLPPAGIIRDVLTQKCAYKEIEIPVIGDMGAYKDAMESNWGPMLRHQLPALPSIESYWDALEDFFEWLEGRREHVRPVLGIVSNSGDLYRPTYGHLGLRTRSGSSLEVIRFAAGNHLCVDLDYTANSGKRSRRIVEPYSLRRANNGNILLYAVRADSGKTRTYKINQINDASVTNQVFTPRFQVELSPASSVSPVPSLHKDIY
jgi:predicted nucleotidyltransferase component of viral defense system